jgi:hypothetical protein
VRKRDEIANPKSCLNKASAEEPLFVLRASDVFAPGMVELWTELAALHGCDPAKLAEARACAAAMRDWPHRKFPD